MAAWSRGTPAGNGCPGGVGLVGQDHVGSLKRVAKARSGVSAWMSTRTSTQRAVVEDACSAIGPGRGDTGGAAGVGNRSRLDDHVALEATGIAHAEEIAAAASGLGSQDAIFAPGIALLVDDGQIA